MSAPDRPNFSGVHKPVGGNKTHRVKPHHSGLLLSKCGRTFEDHGSEPQGTPVSCQRCR